MADESTADDAPVTFHVKSSSDAKYVLTVPLSMTVIDLKTKLSGPEYADIPPDRQRLIYSGRVLKDADTLGSYKVKEGNTVHLVKGAASNQRQNMANQASVNVGGNRTGAQPATGVPTNLATGTGQDPLAGLTGARYAGYAQMPNANMFGPDGGMGPPPDPEQMASMLENPNFASTLNEALSNPQIIDQMIRSNPMLRDMGPQFREIMQDPEFRAMMTNPEAMRNLTQFQRQYGGGFFGGAGRGGNQEFPAPGITDTTPAQQPSAEGETATPRQPDATPQLPPFGSFADLAGAGGAGTANPFAALFGTGGPGINIPGHPPPAPSPTPGATSGATPGATPSAASDPVMGIVRNMMQNPQMMRQMLGAMGGAGANPAVNPDNNHPPNANSAAQTGFNPFALLGGPGGFGGVGGFGSPPPPAPQDDRPPEDRYAEQLTQLNEMGFYEFERNVEALRRTGGNVQGAVEYLLTH